ncbi:hypothetical protein JOF56_007180 [Kibdelosporangium banguiense]|uniref:Small secreted protein n=1 Tax=Kibdelosporangium banguiense TaxID=1365924 RepID=A0ABS4TS69_9PSEU|nr:hypothetical protein [Kibdelosporangium banguiense]MBP2326795.1 hypothetical protein [Kibdelosporangium banguiense]
MPAGRTTIIAVVAGFALVTAGCGGTQQNTGPATGSNTVTQPPSSTSGTVDQAKVDFADDVCGAMQEFITPATSFRPDTSSPAAALNSLKTQLGTMSTGLDKANRKLTDVDAAGVPDGKAAVTELQKTFTQLKQTVDTTKTKLEGVDPNNPQAIGAAVQSVSKDLAALGNMQNPLDQPALKSADMEAAAKRAPACQKIKTQIGGSVTTGSATVTPTTR